VSNGGIYTFPILPLFCRCRLSFVILREVAESTGVEKRQGNNRIGRIKKNKLRRLAQAAWILRLRFAPRRMTRMKGA
jgi:hypothetical protein